MDNKKIYVKPLIKKPSYKILFLGLIIAIVMIIVTTSFFMWKLIVFKDNIDIFSNYHVYTIVGDSMNPKFKSGDIIVVKEVPPDELTSGDIIAFKKDSIVVTHRIEEVHKEVFLTQGDNNGSRDNFSTPSENILGKYVFKIPMGNGILYIVKSPIFTIVIFLLLLVNITLLFRVF